MSDPLFASVKLVAYNENGSGSTFVDQSNVGRALTANGNLAWTTTNPFTGTSSVATFDGNGDYLSALAGADFRPGTGDFTIEGYVRHTTGANNAFYFGPYTSSGDGWGLFKETGTLKMRITGAVQLNISAWSPTDGVVYHLAACRASGVFRLFVDGVQIGSDVANSTDMNTTLAFASGTTPSNLFPLAGQMAGMRYGLNARYTTGFTPPSLPLPLGVDVPVADFSGTPTSGTLPLSVTFTDLSTNTPSSWAWDFGDGNTSTSQNPTNVYSNAGTYTVKLTATNAAGSNQATKSAYITVSEPVASTTPIGGGIPYRGHETRRRTKEEIQREREDYGILPRTAQIIEDVAARQAEDLRLDEQQRFEELQRELELPKVEFEGKHLEYLNARRGELIAAEIARLMKLKLQDDENLTMMLMLASVV